LMDSLPTTPYIHRIHTVLANPMYEHSRFLCSQARQRIDTQRIYTLTHLHTNALTH
jgi:hypothetical protein